MSFDKWIHPYQDTEHFHHPGKFPFLPVPPDFHQVATTAPNINWISFGHCTFHINGIIPYALFCTAVLLRIM